MNSLKYKKKRFQEKKILIEGMRIIKEAQNSSIIIDSIYYTDRFTKNHSRLLDVFKNQDISMILCDEDDIKKLSESKNNQGIIAVVNIVLVSDYDSTADLNGDNVVNVLDIIAVVNITLGS